jgi:hypothetical protein
MRGRLHTEVAIPPLCRPRPARGPGTVSRSSNRSAGPPDERRRTGTTSGVVQKRAAHSDVLTPGSSERYRMGRVPRDPSRFGTSKSPGVLHAAAPDHPHDGRYGRDRSGDGLGREGVPGAGYAF